MDFMSEENAGVPKSSGLVHEDDIARIESIPEENLGNEHLQIFQHKYASRKEGWSQTYNKLKKIVWVIRIIGSRGKEHLTTYLTGFSIKSGVVMTCSHGFNKMDKCSVMARRLDDNDFHKVESYELKSKWDVCLLKIENFDDHGCCGELAIDGSLDVGETICHIGHPDEFVGSFMIGEVAYPCSKTVTFSTARATCSTYKPTALGKTPLYRVMGDVWNSEVIEMLETRYRAEENKDGKKRNPYHFEKNLDPLVPIIQSNGLTSGGGCSGGPVFNVDGKIVGMLVGDFVGYQISIHVTALREFIKTDLVKLEGKLSTDLATSSTSGTSGDSRKRKVKLDG